MLLVRQDVKSRHSRLTTFLYDISKTLQVNLCCPFQLLEKMSMKAPSNNDLKQKENTIITMTQDQTPSCIFITPHQNKQPVVDIQGDLTSQAKIISESK